KDYEYLGIDNPVNLVEGASERHRVEADAAASADAGTVRVMRGGSWASYPVNCRSALRYWEAPTYRGSYLGFRVVCELTRSPAPLVAPFDERAAKARQADWARHLGKSSPVEENTLKMKLVLIPPGEFMMGATEAEIDRAIADYPGTKREWVDD